MIPRFWVPDFRGAGGNGRVPWALKVLRIGTPSRARHMGREGVFWREELVGTVRGRGGQARADGA